MAKHWFLQPDLKGEEVIEMAAGGGLGRSGRTGASRLNRRGVASQIRQFRQQTGFGRNVSVSQRTDRRVAGGLSASQRRGRVTRK